VKTFALALGAGGARGLAHIAIVEALDEMGVKPVAIAGSSIGAVIGAGYAAGMTGRAMRRHIISLAHNRTEILRRVMGARAVAWSEILGAGFGNPLWLMRRSSAMPSSRTSRRRISPTFKFRSPSWRPTCMRARQSCSPRGG
jgi:predicted acylesterase/phospholipase RssA